MCSDALYIPTLVLMLSEAQCIKLYFLFQSNLLKSFNCDLSSICILMELLRVGM